MILLKFKSLSFILFFIAKYWFYAVKEMDYVAMLSKPVFEVMDYPEISFCPCSNIFIILMHA